MVGYLEVKYLKYFVIAYNLSNVLTVGVIGIATTTRIVEEPVTAVAVH